MADLPLAVNVQGDYGYKVIVVDDEGSIDQIISTATDQIVGVLVAEFAKDAVLRARLHDADEPLDNSMSIKDAKLVQMDALQIYAE